MTCEHCGARSATKASLARHIEIRHTNPEPTLLSLLKCANCGGAVPKLQRRYCSPACQAAGVKRAKTGSSNANWRGGLVEKPCQSCGKQFKVKPVRAEVARFCGWKCVQTGKHRGSGGYREDIGIFVRSRWEANYARVLNYMVQQNEITAWAYEAETFPFTGVKGLRSYTPDFMVWLKDGSIEYHEIKGQLDARSLARRKAFGEQYPDKRLVWVGRNEYRLIERRYLWLPHWEESGITLVSQSPLTAMKAVAKTNGIAMFQVGGTNDVWVVMRPEVFDQRWRLADWQGLTGDGLQGESE